MIFESFIKNSDLEITPEEKFKIVSNVARKTFKKRKNPPFLSSYSHFLKKLVKEYEQYCRERGIKSICNIDIIRAAVATGLAYYSLETGESLEDLKNYDFLLSNLVNIYMSLVKKEKNNRGLKKLCYHIIRNKEKILDPLI